MSKPIKMTEQYLNECRADFEKALKLTKLADGKLSFTKVFSVEDKKATVYFTGEAWTKMIMLLKTFDKEVAWHGVARRGDDESKDEYIISDIMVYPQTVTGTSVEMDTEKYAMWLMNNAEDTRFDNIHMQAHSHVNMATTPSSVDLNHQEEILNMLGDEDFYIFMIWNKSFNSTNKVYDLKKNILFEDKDITVKIIGATENIDDFIKNAKDMVVSKAYTSALSAGNYSTEHSYTGRPAGVGAPYNPVSANTAKNTPAAAKDTSPATNNGRGGDGKKSGGKKEKPRTKFSGGFENNNLKQSYLDIYEDDDPNSLYNTYCRG